MLSATTPSSGFERFDEHFQLPAVPKLLSRLLDVLQNERTDATRAARVIERDPGLSAEVLKVVNSAYYSLPRPVSELRFAIAYLGLSEVGRIAMTHMTVVALRPQSLRAEAQLQRFWYQSYITTLAARRVLRHLPGVGSSDDLYSAALLHQLGVLAYWRCQPEAMQAIVDCAELNGLLFSDAAKKLGYMMPKELGAYVARQWRLPKPIVRAAGFHDLTDLSSLPGEGSGAPFDVAIAVGSLAVEQLLRPLNEAVAEHISVQSRRVLGWSKEDYLYLLGEGEEWKLQAERFLRGAT